MSRRGYETSSGNVFKDLRVGAFLGPSGFRFWRIAVQTNPHLLCEPDSVRVACGHG